MRRLLIWFALCLTLSWWGGCSNKTTLSKEKTQTDAGLPDGSSPEQVSQEKTQPEPELPKELTYWKDIKAIIDHNCLNCHIKDGIAPFPLESYKFVKTYKDAIKSSVKERRMPPWSGAQNCNEYKNDISMSEEDIEKIAKWVDNGAPEGNPAHYKDSPPPPELKMSRVDLTLKMKKAFEPKRIPDEYRCFVVDWTPKEVKYISGFEVHPGNQSIVHHVIAYLAPPSEAEKYAKKDPEGNGYRCYGTAGGKASYNWLGVWAPGMPGADYPKNTGIKVEPGSKIIIQVHYNVPPSKKGATDQTSVAFKLEDKVDAVSILLPYANYFAWFRKDGMKIPAGEDNVTHDYNADVVGLISLLPIKGKKPKAFTIHSAMLHMHQLGKAGKLTSTVDDIDQCILDIPKWNFDWQLIYHLKKPITIKAKDKLGISCTWNNTAANQPIVEGQKQDPKDVYWGDGTNDEMCLGVFYVTCGDGEGNTEPCPTISDYL